LPQREEEELEEEREDGEVLETAEDVQLTSVLIFAAVLLSGLGSDVPDVTFARCRIVELHAAVAGTVKTKFTLDATPASMVMGPHTTYVPCWRHVPVLGTGT
jgi:hypothetical protein